MKAFAADFLLPFFAPLDSSGLWTALALTSGFLRVVLVVTGERTENGAGPVVLKRRDALRTLDPGRAASRRLASRPSLATSIAAMPAYPQSSDGQRECFTGFASSCKWSKTASSSKTSFPCGNVPNPPPRRGSPKADEAAHKDASAARAPRRHRRHSRSQGWV